MRVLWLLPKAAPALLRHIGAYVELLALDLEQSRRDQTFNVLAAVVAGVCVFFAVLMGCVVIIALTWDTPYRVPAVAWTGGAFLIVAVLVLIYRSSAMKGQRPFLATVKREWAEDAVVLENIIAEPEHPQEHARQQSSEQSRAQTREPSSEQSRARA